WLSDNGRILYFSSNGHRGFGSFDIYYSKRLGDGWSSWSAPINLGDRINSEGRELFYAPAQQSSSALFTSTRNSDGYGDIKIDDAPSDISDSVVVQTETVAVPVVATKIEEMKYEKNEDIENVITLRGSVVNEKTNQPI